MAIILERVLWLTLAVGVSYLTSMKSGGSFETLGSRSS